MFHIIKNPNVLTGLTTNGQVTQYLQLSCGNKQ